MRFFDLLLNVIVLLLWLNWRSMGFHRPGSYRSSLLHTLRIATPPRPRRWRYLVGLLLLLVVRGLLYHHFGPSARWVPHLSLAVVSLPFRSDLLGRMMLFSGLSFFLTLVVCHLCLLLLSIVNRRLEDTNPVQQLVRLHLGWIEHVPVFLKIGGPLLLTTLLWLALHPLFVHLGLVPPARSFSQTLGQGAILALATVLAWKYLLLGVLALYLLTSYVHLGDSPFWEFISATGSNLLKPLRIVPLRAGKIDFAPVAALLIVWFGTRYAEIGLTMLFEKV